MAARQRKRRSKPTKPSEADLRAWHEKSAPECERLTIVVSELIKVALEREAVPFYRIDRRVKDLESFLRKVSAHDDPLAHAYDVPGIRVLTYVESDVRRVSAVLRALFEVDENRSEDKSAALGVDRVGYRSDHVVATLGAGRAALMEYSAIADIPFEVQMRTILAHAWAEVEHDRSYKFSGTLPIELRRRFRVLAGTLELADNELDRLSKDVDRYASAVAAEVQSGTPGRQSEIELNTVSFTELIRRRFRMAVRARALTLRAPAGGADPVDEMRRFGWTTLGDVGAAIPDDMDAKTAEAKRGHPSNLLGIARDLLILTDPERYFEEVWEHAWTFIHPESITLLETYDVPVRKLMEKYGIEEIPLGFTHREDE